MTWYWRSADEVPDNLGLGWVPSVRLIWPFSRYDPPRLLGNLAVWLVLLVAAFAASPRSRFRRRSP